jgi:hypothetical protein
VSRGWEVRCGMIQFPHEKAALLAFVNRDAVVLRRSNR